MAHKSYVVVDTPGDIDDKGNPFMHQFLKKVKSIQIFLVLRFLL